MYKIWLRPKISLARACVVTIFALKNKYFTWLILLPWLNKFSIYHFFLGWNKLVLILKKFFYSIKLFLCKFFRFLSINNLILLKKREDIRIKNCKLVNWDNPVCSSYTNIFPNPTWVSYPVGPYFNPLS